MPEVITNKQSGNKMWIIIGIILSLIIIAVVWMVGVTSLLKFFSYVAIIIFLLAIAGVLFYLIYDLFFSKKHVDPVFLFRKKLTEAAKRNKPPYLNNLILSGDKGHSRVKFGRITGYCRIQILTERTFYDKNGFTIFVKDPRNPEVRVPKTEAIKEEQDVFAIEKHGFPLNIFTMPDIVRIHPSKHSDLIGDVVIKGFSLIPISEYWFLNDEFIDIQRIDKMILLEALRVTGFVVISEMVGLVQKSMDADSTHAKMMQNKNQTSMPGMDPQQNLPAT